MAVGFLTMTQNYKVLTQKLVQFTEQGQPPMSPAQVSASLSYCVSTSMSLRLYVSHPD